MITNLIIQNILFTVFQLNKVQMLFYKKIKNQYISKLLIHYLIIIEQSIALNKLVVNNNKKKDMF